MDESHIRKLGPMSPEEAEEYKTRSFGSGISDPKDGAEWLDYWSRRAKSAVIILMDGEDGLIRHTLWGSTEDHARLLKWLKEWTESVPDQRIMERLMGESRDPA